MRKNGSLVALTLVALSLAFLVVATGCSDSPSRYDAREVREAVKRAQRLYHRAAALMADVVVQVGDEVTPLETVVKSSVNEANTKVLWDAPVHPKAGPALAEAAKVLQTALRDHPDAPKADTALAQQALARVQLLNAQCQAAGTGRPREQLLAAMGSVSHGIALARGRMDVSAYVRKSGKMSNKDVQKAISDAKGQIADLQRRIRQKDGDAKGRRQELDAALAKVREHNTGYRDLKRRSETAARDQRVPLFDRALVHQREAAALTAKAARTENALDQLKVELAGLKLSLDGAQTMKKASEKLLQQRTAAAQAGAEALAQMDKDLKAILGRIGTSLAEAGASCKALAAAETAALDFYKKAAAAAAKGQTGDREKDTPGLLVGEAAILVTSASAQRQAFQTRQQVRPLLDEAKALLKTAGQEAPKEALDALQAYVADEKELTADMAKKAVALCKKAVERAEQKDKWTYQVHLANAYYLQSQVQGDADALENARKTIRKALDGKEGSPYLAYARALSAKIESN